MRAVQIPDLEIREWIDALHNQILVYCFGKFYLRGADMKPYAAALAVLMTILGLQGQGIAQAQKEKKAMNESGNIAPAQAGSAAWRNFKKPDDATLKKRLTPLQYEVTQKEGTEPPFRNEYDGNKREGIYVDIVSGEPLFSSRDKYDSGTGWPSFHSPLEPELIVERQDRSLWMTRTEVRSRLGGSHLGHVFDDGPAPTGLRYCVNSAALRFIPVADLEREGYGEYLPLFESSR